LKLCRDAFAGSNSSLGVRQGIGWRFSEHRRLNGYGLPE
jgi:hypothetical protein